MEPKKMNKTRQMLTEKFLELLESDTDYSWKKSWNAPSSIPINGATGKRYKGTNQFLLRMIAFQNGYTDSRWMTFQQASEAGYKIRKGEKAIPIEYWFMYDTSERKDIGWKEYYDILKQEPERERDFQLRSYTYYVFNAAQIEGLEPRQPFIRDDFGAATMAMEFCSNLLAELKITLVHGGDQAYYNINSDTIHMPPYVEFHNEYEYYSTLLHETAHATGAEKRMNRDLPREFGTESYAMEELRAEIASCFLSAEIGIDTDTEIHIENHKAYVANWIKVIKDKPEELFRAISAAEKITDYMKEHGELSMLQEKYPEIPPETVGRIYYYGFNGMVQEYIDYDNKKQFQEAISSSFDVGETIHAERLYNMDDKKIQTMKTYYIYNIYTDEYIGELKANSIEDAEFKTWDIFGVGPDDVYAFTEKLSIKEPTLQEMIEKVAAWENQNNISAKNRLTYWFGDYDMYAMEPGIQQEQLVERYQKIHTEDGRKELLSNLRDIRNEKTIADSKKNNRIMQTGMRR